MLCNLAGTVVFARRLLGVPFENFALFLVEMRTRSLMVFFCCSCVSMSASLITRMSVILVCSVVLCAGERNTFYSKP